MGRVIAVLLAFLASSPAVGDPGALEISVRRLRVRHDGSVRLLVRCPPDLLPLDYDRERDVLEVKLDGISLTAADPQAKVRLDPVSGRLLYRGRAGTVPLIKARGSAPVILLSIGDLELKAAVGTWRFCGTVDYRQGGRDLLWRMVETHANTRVPGEDPIVARTNKEWAELWRQHYAGEPPPDLPPVDFERNVVIWFTVGVRHSGGFEAELISVRRMRTGLRVRWRERTPHPRGGGNAAFSYPYCIAAAPRLEGRTQFRRARPKRGCPPR